MTILSEIYVVRHRDLQNGEICFKRLYLFMISSMEKPLCTFCASWDLACMAWALSMYIYSERPKNGFCSIAAGTWWRCCWWCGAKLEDSWCFVNWAYALAAPRFELKNLCDWKFCFEASVSSRTWKGSFVSSPRPVTSTSTSSSEESSSLSSELPVES